MSNRREIEPSLDYFELRRRHEEYKNSQRQKDAPEGEPAPLAEQQADAEPAPKVGNASATEPAGQVRPVSKDVSADADEVKVTVPEPEDDAGTLNLSDSLDAQDAPVDDREAEDAALLDDAMPDDDDPDDEEAESGNPNPFDPFIHAFKGLRGKLSGRLGRRRQDEESEDDEEFEDDEPMDGDEPVDDQAVDANDVTPDEVPAAHSTPSVAPDALEADEAPGADTAVEDILDDTPAGRVAHKPAEDGEPDDEEYEDDGDYEDDEDDASGRISGFKKFMRLFIVPIDEDDEPDDEASEYEEYADEDDGDAVLAHDSADAPNTEEAPVGDDGVPGDASDWTVPAARDNEGGPDMSDLNNVNTELTDALAAGLEGSGMTRRQRRELAQRKAAEQAAAEAAAQAAAAKAEADIARTAAEASAEVAEAATQEAGEVVQTATEVVGEAALEPDTIEDVSKGIVNIESAKDDFDAVADEPTREYKAVSKVNLDDLMNDGDLDDDDEDEDDEEDEKPVRRGLFGRRRRARDEDDEDDDDDDDDEDEDERPRRGLFGRRRRARDEEEDDEDDEDDDDYDDDDEEDDEDDRRGRKSRRGRRHYDEDEEDDDDYDDYDDDDYDDYDDDDESTSFGHVLLGILKGFLTAVMLLLFVVVVLNVLNIFNVVKLDGLAARLPTRMASIFLPSEGMKQRINVEADAGGAPVAEGVPLETQPAPQVEPEPVVEEVPAEEAPAEEVPAAEEAPAEEAPAAEEAPGADNGAEAVG